MDGAESSYWTWHEQGLTALQGARLAEAEDAFLSAHREAKRRQFFALADRAYCNWAAVQFEKAEPADVHEGLSSILGRTEDLKARRLAAYYLAIWYRRQGLPQAARLYADMSNRLAEILGDSRSQASSLHLLGLLSLQESRPGAARESLRKSLEIRVQEGDGPHLLMTMSTLGYCLSLTGDDSESRWLLEETLGSMGTASSWKVYEPSIRLNLGFSSLERGECDEALDHARAALVVAEERGPVSEAKFIYYLLGEAYVQVGARRAARDCFEILEKEYYPQYPGLSDLLLSCRTSQFLNWLSH